jgi:23S rRNA pseudouridine1911/1915/1917 synthase
VTLLPPSKGPSLPFPILYEDEGLIVIDKPAGLLSVATDREKDRTAYHILTEYLRGRDPRTRLFIVHRLDRDTSGVLLFAKNEALKTALQDSWNDLVQKRGYWTVVEGPDIPDSGTCRSLLTENSIHKVYSVKGDSGKEAVTRYRVLARSPRFALLDVDIDTGRKNQIRTHLSELGHPVTGDKKYGAAGDPMGRLALHAYQLSLTDPRTQALLSFSAPAPAGFQRLFPKQLCPGKK